MIAKQAYEAQGVARDAERAYFDYAAENDGLDAARVAEGLKLKMVAAREQAARLQAEAGGVVYFVYADCREDIEAKLAKIARRAAKLAVQPPVLRWHEKEIVKVIEQVEGRRREVEYEKQYVAVAGQAPRLAGYRFLASIEHLEGANLVCKVPGNDDIDTAAYRFVGPECAHCGLDRRRKNSFLVQHEDGSIFQVGRNCLADFLGGLSPQSAVKMFEWFGQFADFMDGESDPDRERSVKVVPVVRLADFLGHVSCMMREHGWVSAGMARDDYSRQSTREAAEINRSNQARKQCDRQGNQLWVDPSDEDFARADAAIVWVRREFGAKVFGDRQAEGASDFEHNLAVAMNSDVVAPKAMGLAACCLSVMDRALAREVEAAREAEKGAASEHIGAVKERLALTLTVEAVFASEGHYGTTYITRMSDANGAIVKWFGSYGLDTGVTYTGKWTVKDHSEYKGVKETIVTRPANLTEVPEEALV